MVFRDLSLNDHGSWSELQKVYAHANIHFHYTLYKTIDYCQHGINMLRHSQSHLECLGGLANASHKGHLSYADDTVILARLACSEHKPQLMFGLRLGASTMEYIIWPTESAIMIFGRSRGQSRAPVFFWVVRCCPNFLTAMYWGLDCITTGSGAVPEQPEAARVLGGPCDDVAASPNTLARSHLPFLGRVHFRHSRRCAATTCQLILYATPSRLRAPMLEDR